MAPLHQLTAQEALHHLSQGTITSEALVQALLQRRAETEPHVNAFSQSMHASALDEAGRADDARRRGYNLGPLHGLPVTIKESVDVRGVDSTMGLTSQTRRPAARDAVVVQALRAAGAVILGKTNVSQLLLFNESTNAVYGTTRNPWRADRVPGGSSGGEAAALAAGSSLAGIGTDIGGSIRVPAAFCGVAGLKPTCGRWSTFGCHTAMPGQPLIRGQVGPMARTAGDVRLLFESLDSVRMHQLDGTVPPLPTVPVEQVDLSKIRIGFFDTDGIVTPAASVQRAVRAAVDGLRVRGLTVLAFPPPKAVEIIQLYFGALSADGGRTITRQLKWDPVAPQLRNLKTLVGMPDLLRKAIAMFLAAQGDERIERIVRVIREKRVDETWRLAVRRQQLVHETLLAWQAAGIDALVCPPYVTPALYHGQSGEFALGGTYAYRYNALDFPAGVVPVSRVRRDEMARADRRDRVARTAAAVERDSAGLPVAVQVVAKPYQEHVALAVMQAIEGAVAAQDGFPRTPVNPASISETR